MWLFIAGMAIGAYVHMVCSLLLAHRRNPGIIASSPLTHHQITLVIIMWPLVSLVTSVQRLAATARRR